MSSSIGIWTGRNAGQRVNVVCRASNRAGRHNRAGTAEVGNDVAGRRSNTSYLARFQSPLLFRRVNDAEIIDTGIGLRGLTGSYEVRNRDCRQQADDGHNDHDFHQRKAGFQFFIDCFHFLTFWFCLAVERNSRRVII